MTREQPVGQISNASRETAVDRRLPWIAPDLAACGACLAEIADPASRRYRYPFNSCPACGPRYTIATGGGGERLATSMRSFPMCGQCAGEVADPSSRRFGYQLNSCPSCGPELRALTPRGAVVDAHDPIGFAARSLRAQLIVALKGTGSHHIVCDATSSLAVVRLRERRRHDERPLPVMFPTVEEAEKAAMLSAEEKALLASPERPVVIAPRRNHPTLASEVSGESSLIHCMLPETPLHHLLLAAAGTPLVVSAGATFERRTAYRDADALTELHAVADLFVLHNREISCPAEESVARVIAGKPAVLRRGRGFVARPIPAPRSFDRPVLACGGREKSAFCIGLEQAAIVGPEVDHFESPDRFSSFVESLDQMLSITGVVPEVVAHDLDRTCLSTRYALTHANAETVEVQHHHAHLVSCMAEWQIEGAVIGAAFDGGGIGTDGTSWGGEIMVATAEDFERVGTIRAVRLPGGQESLRQIWRIALALLDDAFDGEPPLHVIPLFRRMPRRVIDVVRKMATDRTESPLSHSLGRYFDAIGSVVLGRPDSLWEGEVAIEWNLTAASAERGRYPIVIRGGASPLEIDLRPVVKGVVDDFVSGRSAASIAGKFHNTIALATAEVVNEVRTRFGNLPVVLSGGCFQNHLLAEQTLAALGSASPVHLHATVSPAGGGISLGQAIIADAVARRRARSRGQAAATSHQLESNARAEELAPRG